MPRVGNQIHIALTLMMILIEFIAPSAVFTALKRTIFILTSQVHKKAICCITKLIYLYNKLNG